MIENIVIMAGGVGSRLYPLSTPERPKQFLDILGVGKTLIQLTYDRFRVVNPEAQFWVVTSRDYVHYVREQLPGIPPEHILREPAMRNTAPCISYACRKILHENKDSLVAVTPADAYVPDVNAFAGTMRTALGFAAEKDAIVCIGIAPDRPCPDYGYIYAPAAEKEVTAVGSFKEKPSVETAGRYLEEGGYWWNAGIFVARADVLGSELRCYAPEIEEVMDRIEADFNGPGEEMSLSVNFPLCPKISIDYAVIEKSAKVYALAASWEWSDLGSFEAIEKIRGKIL